MLLELASGGDLFDKIGEPRALSEESQLMRNGKPKPPT